LDNFNISLLAKQGWRFRKFLGTLVARVMKAKYYPNGDFQWSSLGAWSSFAWRSVWNSKHVLQEGLIWHIGDGSQVKIWGDRWLPSTQSHIIQSLVNVLQPNAKVCELISVESKWWNIPLLERVFPADLVETICNSPICPHLIYDRLVWAGTTTRLFSVRSGYHLECERRTRIQGSCSNAPTINPIWHFIWSLSIPQSVQLFIRRACNEILPTKEKLCHRRVVEDPICPMCGKEVESGFHALWRCPAAQTLWAECPNRITKCSSSGHDVLSLMGALFQRLDREEMELVVMVAQRVWYRRNKFVFEGLLTPPTYLIKCAKESWMSTVKRRAGIPSLFPGLGFQD